MAFFADRAVRGLLACVLAAQRLFDRLGVALSRRVCPTQRPVVR